VIGKESVFCSSFCTSQKSEENDIIKSVNGVIIFF